MFKIDDVGSTFASLPPNMQDPANACYGYALDRQMKRLHDLADSLTVWSNLDAVNPRYYDQLAMTIRAPYYKPEYSDRQKLSLIKNTLMFYRYAGTVRAISELASTFFADAKYIPWFEYDGDPYHFKICVSEEPTTEAKAYFAEMLKRVKAARSILDGVEIHQYVDGKLHVGMIMLTAEEIMIQNKSIIP